MRFEPVEKIPARLTRHDTGSVMYKPLTNYLKEFLKMRVKYVRVHIAYGEYADMQSAYTVIYETAKKASLPIKVMRRDGEIFLENLSV